MKLPKQTKIFFFFFPGTYPGIDIIETLKCIYTVLSTILRDFFLKDPLLGVA